MTIELWETIPGHNAYEASTLGRIRSNKWDRPRILKPSPRGTGYMKVSLTTDGKQVTRNIHQLVAEAWLGPVPAGEEVRHLNGDKLDCRLVNLEYGTRSQNVLDSVQHGTHGMASRTTCPEGHPLDGGGTERSPGRYCKRCRREKKRAAKAAND